MDIVTYALSKKLVNGIQSGLASATVDNDNCSITFNWTNGTSSTMTFPKPDDGVSITNAYIDDTNHLMMELSSGATIDAGVITGGDGGSYDDTAIKADIDSLEGKEIDTLTYANSELTLTAKDTTTKTVTIKPNLVDLGDVDITSPNGGDVVTYSASTGKFTTGQVLSTDQYVKMTASDTNAGYLADLIDDDTIKNNGGKLEVEKIKGQNITVDELNTLLGMDTNVKDSLNALASGGMVFKDVVQTYADLPTGALNGFVYIVNTDETDDNNRNAYIYSDVHNGYVLVGTSGLEVRDFTTNPIDLENEVIGVLPKDKMQTTDLVDKTKDVIDTLSYPIPNEDLEKIPNLKVLKQINTEVINALNGKMNNTDIVDNLTDNSVDKPLSANQGNVLDTKIGHKIDKSNIVTTLDDTVTNEQVVGAKSVYNATVDKNLKTYTSIEQLGLTTPTTVGAIYNAIPANSCLNIFVSLSSVTDLPLQQGLLSITKISTAGFDIIFKRSGSGSKADNAMYIGQLKGVDGTGLSWKRLCTTSVADVPKTAITWSDETNYKTSYTGCYYMVKNGICYVALDIVVTSAPTTGVTLPSVSLPKGSFDFIHRNITSYMTIGGTALTVAITNGTITLYNGTNGDRYLDSFSYPVSES